jgi:hypothetical protein
MQVPHELLHWCIIGLNWFKLISAQNRMFQVAIHEFLYRYIIILGFLNWCKTCLLNWCTSVWTHSKGGSWPFVFYFLFVNRCMLSLWTSAYVVRHSFLPCCQCFLFLLWITLSKTQHITSWAYFHSEILERNTKTWNIHTLLHRLIQLSTYTILEKKSNNVATVLSKK